ncbi:MAG: primosomal protein N', partial [Acidobacteriota bacterium]
MSILFARVAIPTPVRNLFTYKIPDPLQSSCRPGMRVVVPFGTNLQTGFITELSPAADLPDSRIREILELLDPIPVLTPQLLEFTRWVADYYLASWGEVIKAALPAGIHVRSIPGYRITEAGKRALEGAGGGDLQGGERQILEQLSGAGPVPKNRLGGNGKAGQRRAIRIAESLVGRSWLVPVPVRTEPRVKIRKTRMLELAPGFPAGEWDRAAGRSRAARRILEELGNRSGPVPVPELTERIRSPQAAIRKLLGAGAIRELWREASVAVEGDPGDLPEAEDLQLNPEQSKAVEAAVEGLENQEFQVLLLKGITGSGKTEVYLRAIREAADRGRRALYLVPEISLTPLLERTIRSRFPGEVAVMHSGLAGRARLEAWQRIREGKATVVLGTRSAVFAPQPDLGLIIVDEEQEESYKQSESPRYHGRDAAVMRGKLEGALVLLGTATPSLETYHHSVTGRYRLLELTGRVRESKLPQVTVVDMRQEFRRRGERVILSARLVEALQDRRERGEQSLVLLNRRGWAAYLICRSCGGVLQCPRCS